MTDFYAVLNQYYDQLFPVEEETLTLLADTFQANPAPGPIVDAACGTGNYTDALNRKGINCVGFDRDPAMIDRARSTGKRGEFFVHDLLRLATLPVARAPGGVFCIGNSLPHLPDRAAAAQFFEGAMELPSPVLVVQTINFARFSPTGPEVVPLPPVNRPGITMHREYLAGASEGLVDFRMRLETRANGAPTAPVTRTVPLLTLEARELARWAREAGFAEIFLYGDYNRGAYHREHSFLIVLVAHR